MGFCNARYLSNGTYGYNGDGYGTQNSAYAPAGSLYSGNNWKITLLPTLQCANKERDLFTVNNTNTENKGNKKLTYSIGLITSDEVIFAGGFGRATKNLIYYLYTNQNYWTMSSSSYYGGAARTFSVASLGYLDRNNVVSTYGLRPVINLRADTVFTGEGSESSPFVVVY